MKLYLSTNPNQEIQRGQKYDNVLNEINALSITPREDQKRILIKDHVLLQESLPQQLKNIKQQHQAIKQRPQVDQAITQKLIQFIPEIKESQIEAYNSQTNKLTQNLQQHLNFRTDQLDLYVQLLEKFQQLSQQEELAWWFLEKYPDESSSIFRYGINVAGNTQQLQQLVEHTNNVITQLTKSQQGQTGSQSQSSSAKTTELKILSPLEMFLMQEAIQKGLEKNKVILLDIFARGKDGNIITQQDNPPEIHTIVLYKSNEQEFIVIDPNNSTFSNHLANDINTNIFNFTFNTQIKILAPISELKIYERLSNTETGLGPEKWRDCIDTAVKLASGLNQLQLQINTQDIRQLGNNIKKTDPVQLVTNQQRINESLLNFVETDPVRIRQTSNCSNRTQANLLLARIETQLEQVREYPKHSGNSLEEKIEDLYRNTFTQYDYKQPSEQLEKLDSLYKSITEVIEDFENEYNELQQKSLYSIKNINK